MKPETNNPSEAERISFRIKNEIFLSQQQSLHRDCYVNQSPQKAENMRYSASGKKGEGKDCKVYSLQSIVIYVFQQHKKRNTEFWNYKTTIFI